MRAKAIVGALLVMVLAACGGREFDLGDGGGDLPDAAQADGGGGGDGGKTCTPLPGCNSRTTCPSDCNTCFCSDGEWSCTLIACDFDASVSCPATAPGNGTFCPSNGERCADFGRCSPQCTCTNHAWQCSYPPCVAPPPCPPDVPRAGESCAPWAGEGCSYGSGCGMTSCTCAQSAAPTWTCLATGCADAGH